ncbi:MULTISPECIES: MFS transporter [Actinomycetes]|uniref:MFS transporter n=1 Tax=Actinomycetes TaxID=1760 RepID=UPI0004BF04E3|nr:MULTISPECIES: MFS transporter [Actinomycetes]
MAATSAMAMLVLDSSIIAVMLPSMSLDLGLTAIQQTWTISAYLLTLAVLLPIGGRLVDAIGPVRGFAVGAAGFVVSSLVIGTAHGPVELVSARAAAGAAAAIMMPATLASVFAAFAPGGRPRAVSLYTGAGQAVAALGPTIGGLCAQFLTWRWGFLMNVPIGVIAAAVMCTAHLHHRPGRRPMRDGLGTSVLIVGLSSWAVGLLVLPTSGAKSPAVLALLGVGVTSGGLYIWRGIRGHDNLADRQLFTNRHFRGSAAILLCLGFAMTALTIYPVIALQNALLLTPAVAGVALLPLVVPLLVATRWAGRRYGAVGPRLLGIWGALATAAGCVLVAAALATTSTWLLCCGLIPAGVGVGLLMSPMTTTAVDSVTEPDRGQASGLSAMLRQFGGLLSVAAFGMLAHNDSAPHGGGTIGFYLAAVVMLAAAVLAATELRPCPHQPSTASLAPQ